MRTLRVFNLLILLSVCAILGATEKAEAQGRASAKTKRSPASAKSQRPPWLSIPDPKTHTYETFFSVGGEQYFLKERRNGKGVVTEQILLSKGRVQISIDRDGDGSLDSWESHTKGKQIFMRDPENGKFQFMDVMASTKNSIVMMKFVRRENDEFEMYSRQEKPHLSMMAGLAPEDFVVGCRSREWNIQSEAAQINEILAMTDSDQRKLRSDILSKIVDKSCKTSDWEIDSMLDGMLRVYGSDEGFKTKQLKTLKEQKNTGIETWNTSDAKDQPMYLGCLRYYELDTHASRISASLFTHLKTENPYPWKIACRDAADKETLGTRGQTFFPAGQAPTVSFVKDKRNNGKMCDHSPSEFANTFFHEMLHYSLIQDEKLVKTIESCCSQTNPMKESCISLKARVEARKIEQKVQNHFVKQLGHENYKKFKNLAEEVYGGSERVDRFYRSFGEAQSEVLNGSACPQETKEEKFKNKECRGAVKVARKKVINETFGEAECLKNISSSAGTVEARRKQCKEISGLLLALMGADASLLEASKACKEDDDEKQTALLPWRPFLLWSPNLASAAEKEMNAVDLACDLVEGAQKMKFNMKDTDWAPSDEVYDTFGKEKDPSARIDSAIGEAGDKPISQIQTLTPGSEIGDAGNVVGNKPGSASGGKHGSIGRETQGPSTPDYSSRPTERAQRIAETLRRERETDSRISRYLDTSIRQNFPEARAELKAGSSTSEAYQRPSRSNTSGSESMNRQQSSAPLRLPDPMAARFPASIGTPITGAQNPAAAQAQPIQPARANSEKAKAQAKPDGPSARAQNQASASSAGSGVVGGLSNAQAGNAPSPAQKSSKVDPSTDRRELKAFITYMVRLDSPRMKIELKRPSVQKSLIRHKIAVVDEENQRHGYSETPVHWLIYDQALGRFQHVEEKAAK